MAASWAASPLKCAVPRCCTGFHPSIDQLEGRITVGLVTPYPPGIPLLIPGEVFNKKIVDYLKFSREFNTACPGFETDVHGLVEELDADGKTHYFADCVRE